MTDTHETIYIGVNKNVRRIPRVAWACALVVSVATVNVDVFSWASHRKIDWLVYAVMVSGIGVYLAALYRGSINTTGVKPTTRGYMRFSAATLSLWSPLIATLGVLAIFKEQVPQDTRIWIFLVAILFTVPLSILLTAWPLFQASSTTLVSPIRLFQATRGHRWSLFSSYFFIAGTNGDRILPDIASAKFLGQAAFFGLLHASFAVFGFAIMASTIMTAWQFATNNDASLKAPSDLPEALSA